MRHLLKENMEGEVHGSAWLGEASAWKLCRVFSQGHGPLQVQDLDLLGIQTSAFPGLEQKPTENVTGVRAIKFLRSCQ